jgi:hypothetical protein
MVHTEVKDTIESISTGEESSQDSLRHSLRFHRWVLTIEL